MSRDAGLAVWLKRGGFGRGRKTSARTPPKGQCAPLALHNSLPDLENVPAPVEGDKGTAASTVLVLQVPQRAMKMCKPATENSDCSCDNSC